MLIFLGMIAIISANEPMGTAKIVLNRTYYSYQHDLQDPHFIREKICVAQIDIQQQDSNSNTAKITCDVPSGLILQDGRTLKTRSSTISVYVYAHDELRDLFSSPTPTRQLHIGYQVDTHSYEPEVQSLGRDISLAWPDNRFTKQQVSMSTAAGAILLDFNRGGDGLELKAELSDLEINR